MDHKELVGRHPVSVLHEHCNQNKLTNPKFEEHPCKSQPYKPVFSFVVTVEGKTYGPAYGTNKSDAKAKAAGMACDDLGIIHSGRILKTLPKPTTNRNAISILFEYVQLKKWPKPKDLVAKDEGPAHEKYFAIQYKIAEKIFPIGAGKNKDVAKRRAAARALCDLKQEKMREHMRGPDPDVPFGQQIADYAWEAFGILCEELGESPEFCVSSHLAAFIVENIEDGSLRVVSLGTGSRIANKNCRVHNGESVIDCHAVVVARRGLLVFLYEQLLKLLNMQTSIFEYSSPTVAALKENYVFHLYMKDPPCGDGAWYTHEKDCEDVIVDNDHTIFFRKDDGHGKIQLKKEKKDIVSCSDKILLWNSVGLQGGLLTNFIPQIFLDSITLTNNYAPKHLTRALCCRYQGKQMEHPWMQQGIPSHDISTTTLISEWKKYMSIYWTHATLNSLEEDLEDLANKGGGILDSDTGQHIQGSDREGEIPTICKRYLFIKFKQLCYLTGGNFNENESYLDHKSKCREYRLRKNEFFETLDKSRLGDFPIMDRNVDIFYLPKES